MKDNSKSPTKFEKCFQIKEAIHDAKLKLGRWLIDSRIPFNAIQSPYFKDALNGIFGIGHGLRGPFSDELRVHLLGDLKKESSYL